MKNFFKLLLFVLVFVIINNGGCCSGDCDKNTTTNTTTNNNRSNEIGKFKNVSGVHYRTTSGIEGYTKDDGSFEYKDGDDITFSIAEAELGTVKAKSEIDVFDFKKPVMVNQVLNSFDSDLNPTNGYSINISKKEQKIYKKKLSKRDAIDTIKISQLSPNDENYIEYLQKYSKNRIFSYTDSFKNIIQKKLGSDILQLNKKINKENRITKVLSGALSYEKLIPEFGSYPTTLALFNSNDPEFRTKYRLNILLFSDMQSNYYSQISNKSKEVINRIEESKKEIENVMAVVDEIYNQVGIIIDKGLKNDSLKETMSKVELSLGKAGAMYVVNSIQDDMTKLTSELVVNTVASCILTDDPEACAIDTMKSSAKIFIHQALADNYPMLASNFEGITDNIADSVSAYLTCINNNIGKSGTKLGEFYNCGVKISQLLYKNLMTLGNNLYHTYKLDKDLPDINDRVLGYEIAKALVTSNVNDPLHEAIFVYFNGGRDQEYSEIKDRDERWEKLCSVVMKSNKVKGLYSPIIGEGYNCSKDTEGVRKYYHEVLDDWFARRENADIFIEKFLKKDKNGNYTTDISEQDYYSKEINTFFSDFSIQKNENGDYYVSSLLNIVPKGLNIYLDSIELKILSQNNILYSNTINGNNKLIKRYDPEGNGQIPIGFSFSSDEIENKSILEINAKINFKVLYGDSRVHNLNTFSLLTTDIQYQKKPDIKVTSSCKNKECII